MIKEKMGLFATWLSNLSDW